MKTLKLFFLIIILCSNSSFGQGEWTHYTKKEGLASTWIRDCLEDKQGNMWFATDKGLCKFDGVKIETFTKKDGLPVNTVMNLFTDKNGSIWFTTESPGLTPIMPGSLLEALTKKGNGWGRYDEEKIVSFINKGLSEYIWSKMVNVDGEIWIGGIIRKSKMGFFLIDYDGQSWNPVTQLGGVNFIPISYFFCEGKDNIWISSGAKNGDFISHFDGSNWSSYGEKDGLPSGFLARSISNHIYDSKGNIWFGTHAGSLMKFDGTSWTTYTEDNGVIGNSINIIVEDNDGNIWVATNEGLNVFDGASWEYFSEKDKLPSKLISVITVDSKGRVWIGTAEGLLLFDHGKWSTINKKNGLTHNSVRSIVEDTKGNIWVGAAPHWKSGGVSIYNGNTWENLELSKLYANDFFEDSKGNMWILTFGKGVFKFEY